MSRERLDNWEEQLVQAITDKKPKGIVLAPLMTSSEENNLHSHFSSDESFLFAKYSSPESDHNLRQVSITIYGPFKDSWISQLKYKTDYRDNIFSDECDGTIGVKNFENLLLPAFSEIGYVLIERAFCDEYYSLRRSSYEDKLLTKTFPLTDTAKQLFPFIYRLNPKYQPSTKINAEIDEGTLVYDKAKSRLKSRDGEMKVGKTSLIGCLLRLLTANQAFREISEQEIITEYEKNKPNSTISNRSVCDMARRFNKNARNKLSIKSNLILHSGKIFQLNNDYNFEIR